jgi:hypothetical protein
LLLFISVDTLSGSFQELHSSQVAKKKTSDAITRG